MQINLETCTDVADYLGDHYLEYGTIETIDQRIAKYKAVTLDQIKQVASKLSADNLYMYHIE